MMKKIISLLFIASVYVLNAQAIRFGAKGGLNIAKITNIEGNVSPKLAFHAGFVTEFQLSDKVYAQPELLYSLQGISKNEDYGNRDYRLNYISIPMMIKYYLKGGLCVEAGPVTAFNLGGTLGRGINKQEIKDLNGLDFGGAIGLNYMMKNTINFGVRANIGSSDIFDGNEFEPSQNQVLQFSVGYFF